MSTGVRSPMLSEAVPMSQGEIASPSRCISIVVNANPRARRLAGSTLAMAALSGPMLTNTRSSVPNMAGQNTAGDGASTAARVNGSEAASDHPETVKSPPGQRRATALATMPPISVPANPATTSSTPKIVLASRSGRPRSRTK